MRKEWLLVAALAATGCAPVQTKIFDPAISTPAKGRFPVSVERGKWAGVNLVPLGVFIDGKLDGVIGGGQSVTFYLTEGRHTVGVGAHGRSPMLATPSTEIVVDISESSRPILEANVSALGYGGWKLNRISQ